MNGYFIPRNRKNGVVTLFVACIAMSLWFRSDWIADTFTIPYRADHYFQISLSARSVNLGLLSISGKTDQTKTRPYFWMTDAAEPVRSIPGVGIHATPGRGVRRFLDFGDTSVSTAFELQPFSVYLSTPTMRTASGGEYPIQFSCLTIPGWPIVLSLALSSAYLLLSKWRAKRSTPNQDIQT
ncbi:hypothetical protein [Schlesneria paludicola]|uniref:hypothetical protein n=1 Tax=Schlesneria paludicola TaxID=360056 RepID=UPI00029B1D53|nr:hypothetical protein [Schlesneria paludicola]